LIDTAVILAVSSAAHGSQLQEKRPRAMLPALGKPMVVRVMDRLYSETIRRFKIIVGVNDGAIVSYLKNQWMPDATVEPILQTNESLGLLMARIARTIENPFIVASYNSFTFARYIRVLFKQHQEHEDALILTGANLTLSPDALTNRYAVLSDENVTNIVPTKPTDAHYVLTEHSVCGYQFVEHLQALDDRTASSYGKTWFDIIRSYINTPNAQVKLAETSWILRVESDADLLTLNKRLLDDSNDGHVLSELPYTVKVNLPVRIDPQVSVGQHVEIGPHVYIERGSSIGYGAKIKNAVVLAKGNVPSDSIVENAIVTSRRIVNV